MARHRDNKARPLDNGLRRQIEAALAANAIARAAKLAETALARGQADPMILNLVAWRREEAGDYAGAHDLLQRALALAPGDPLILAAIAAVLRKEGAFDEALSLLDRVLAVAPQHAAAWLERGYVLDSLHNAEDATISYQRALAIDSSLAPALGKLADGAAKRGDLDAARELAAEALALAANEPSGVFALVAVEIETGRADHAETRLQHLLTTDLPPDDRTRALTLLGDAMDRQGRTTEAFAAFSAAQRNFRDIYLKDFGATPQRPSHRAYVERIAEQVRAQPASPSPAAVTAVPGEAATHVFLLGYPRSGTTLVENVLASADGVSALEERATLIDSDEALIANDGAMLRLDALDPTIVERLRGAYWQRVVDYGGPVEERIFVDMNPLNASRLPVIARLFPQAKIVIMRRDPRDVILSCYRINFMPSPVAWTFSDLAEAARHYDATMRLTELCRERLPLQFFEMRYDALISDFREAVAALASFIGIPWTEDFTRFDRTAQTRGVRTASAGQVRRGLYDGRGQWRRYENELAPALPILNPWVRRFGFEP